MSDQFTINDTGPLLGFCMQLWETDLAGICKHVGGENVPPEAIALAQQVIQMDKSRLVRKIMTRGFGGELSEHYTEAERLCFTLTSLVAMAEHGIPVELIHKLVLRMQAGEMTAELMERIKKATQP